MGTFPDVVFCNSTLKIISQTNIPMLLVLGLEDVDEMHCGSIYLNRCSYADLPGSVRLHFVTPQLRHGIRLYWATIAA